MTQQTMNPQPANNNSRTLIIIVVVVIVLLCCCVIGAVGTLFIYRVSKGIPSNINQQFPVPSETSVPSLPGSNAGALPQGGITDHLLRQDTWQTVSAVVTGMGCEPNVAASSIVVTTKPDASGAWSEKWTVACQSGGTKAFNVDFTPSSQGGTDFNITPLP